MTTSESKGRFFYKNESIRINSHNESNRIDSNLELECSNGGQASGGQIRSHIRLFLSLPLHSFLSSFSINIPSSRDWAKTADSVVCDVDSSGL